jgi:hypothetical protein
MIRPRTLVLAAIAVLALLAGTLGFRLLNGNPATSKPAPTQLPRFTGAAVLASVSAPLPIGALKVPCWGCPDAEKWPIRFQTDLDLLAPLGNGTVNAALWLKDFSKQVGEREADAEQAANRRVEGPGDYGKVLPGNDPLLAEAEPWADQGVMRLYPDVYPAAGFETRLPNLLFALTLSKSWAARAATRPDSPSALEDARRAIRWGRLLRQDDATIVQDLVGIACIRLGAAQLYDLAVRRGDHQLALASAIVMGEHAPQRLRTAQILTRLELTAVAGFEPTHLGRVFKSGHEVSESKLAAVLEIVKSAPDRRFRLEAIAQLHLVRQLGSKAQQARVEETLDGLIGGPDPLVAAAARHARQTTIDEETLGSVLKKGAL